MESRERSPQPPPPDTKRGGLAEKGPGFFERALAALRSWGGPKKPDNSHLGRLRELKNSEKKQLARDVSRLKEKDEEEGKPDVRSHVVELYADELADGVIEVGDLYKIADLLSEHVAKDPKKQDRYYLDHLKLKITSFLYERRAPLPGSESFAERDKRQEEMAAKAIPLAEKMFNAPRKFFADVGGFVAEMDADRVDKEKEFLSQTHGELTVDQVKKIIAEYPNDYGATTTTLEEIMAKATVLEVTGMPDCARALKDLDAKYSPVDGAFMRTPQERAAYLETLMNPGELKAEWYATKPKEYNKRFSREFVATKVIPKFLADKTPFEEAVKQMHWFQIAGSRDQMGLSQKLERDIAGDYRKNRAWIGNEEGGIALPSHETVPEMMKKFADQVEAFSAQLEAKKDTMTAEDFEERVFEYACFVLQRFVDIHPMAEGNGRTARSLYEYTIGKHLGVEKMNEYSSKYLMGDYESFPLGSTQNWLRYTQQMEFLMGNPVHDRYEAARGGKISMDPYFDHLRAHLEETDIEQEVFNEAPLKEFAAKVKRHLLENKTKYARV